jgi:tRNA(Arg) A34 adenosine deaminase TadA
MTDAEFMRRAADACRLGIDAGQSPFGCVIARDGRVVAEAHNTVWADKDPTAHAEVNALRSAAAALGSIDLAGCTLYATCEPCPMCLAASHWAKVGRVVFGASIADADAAGFSELPIPAARLVELGRSPLVVQGGVLREACVRLFEEWKAEGRPRAY